MEEMTRVLKKEGLMCLIVPHGFKEHRFPVDCYRFLSDGMIALSRYVGLEPLHVHTNCAPTVNDTDWYSRHNDDSILVARKPFDGPAQHPNFKTYHCVPVDQTIFRDGFIPMT
jgi:hypothetical protein